MIDDDEKKEEDDFQDDGEDDSYADGSPDWHVDKYQMISINSITVTLFVDIFVEFGK